jgi:hypothetical protein
VIRMGWADRHRVNGRQKKAVVPRKGSKGDGKAPPKGKRRMTPQTKDVADDGERRSLVLRA